MFKTWPAIVVAATSLTAPAFAQDIKVATAPVVKASALPSSGLAAAAVAGGVALVAVGAIAVLASDGDDSTSTTTTTN